MIYPEEFQKLLDNFQYLPWVGKRTAERYIYAIGDLEIDKVEEFAKSLISYKANIKKCSICGHLTNANICSICSSDKRDKSTICVVVDSKSVFKFEETGKYNGVYHVLGGLISPIDEVNPDDININSLISNRINENVKEIIIALNPSIEGQTTSLYIQKLLPTRNDIKLSRLSYGIPVDADIDYIDPLTIIRAMEDRKYLS